MIELTGVSPRFATASIIDRGGFIEPFLGGKTTRLDRPGNKYSIQVTLPPLRNNEIGQGVVVDLIQAKTEGLRIAWPLMGLDTGSPVSPKVDGSNQQGTALVVDGLPSNYAAKKGQFFSLEHNGQHFLYCIKAVSVANASGEAIWNIVPALRKKTLDSSSIHLNPPKIEGYVKGNNWEWEMQLANILAISFTIEEAE